MAHFWNMSPRTTDQWETVHVSSNTGDWDKGKNVIKDSGFNTAILAEHIAKFNGGKEFPNTFGYFDDGMRFPTQSDSRKS